MNFNAPTAQDMVDSGTATIGQTAMIFGDSGTGKTLLACSVSKYKRVLYFDLEQSRRTLFSPSNAEHIDLSNIIVQPVHDTVKQNYAWDVFKRLFAFEDVTLCHTHGIMTCPACKGDESANTTYNLRSIPEDMIVVIDSGTQLDVSIATKVYGTTKGAWVENQKAGYSEWNQMRGIWDDIGTTVQSAGQIPLSLIIVFHEAETDDGKQMFPTLATRSYGKTFAKYFANVVRTHSRNSRYGYDVRATDSGAIAKNVGVLDGMKSIDEFKKLWVVDSPADTPATK